MHTHKFVRALRRGALHSASEAKPNPDSDSESAYAKICRRAQEIENERRAVASFATRRRIPRPWFVD